LKVLVPSGKIVTIPPLFKMPSASFMPILTVLWFFPSIEIQNPLSGKKRKFS
jgi:hypothetical protein